jgi:hypothetical protein
MGREIRRVPANWQHPKKDRYNPRTQQYEPAYKPMHDGGFEPRLAEWLKDWEAWRAGGYAEACNKYPEYVNLGMPAAMAEYHGGPPDPSYYTPDWPDAERTHFQLYETVSEGTPLSPPMPTPEALARWLADNHKPWGGESRNLSYEEWLKFIGVGWAPSMMYSPQTGVVDGVQAVIKGK